MATQNVQDPEKGGAAAAWALGRAQHGVITRGQLLRLGFTKSAIRHRVAIGRLHPLMPGVYAIGRRELDDQGRWSAAVVAAGDGALLSHGSAAALWGIRKAVPLRIDVIVPPSRRPRRPDLRIHRQADPAATRPHAAGRTVLQPSEDGCLPPRHRPRRDPRRWSYRWVLDGIPVTGPIPTLIDFASAASNGDVEAAVNEADHRRLVDPESLRLGVDLFPLRPGAKRLRQLLDEAELALTSTELERLFRPLAQQVGLPPPRTQSQQGTNRVDFFWPQLSLVVETDSLRYHRTAFKQAEDKRRDNANTLRGLVTLRFSHGQVRDEPRRVRAELRTVAKGLQRNAGPKVPS